jgi:hypothetical protein
MSALGLAIMIVAGVVTVDIVLENTRNTDASIVGQTVSNVDLGGFLVVGVLIGIAFMLGVMLLLAGLRRANRKRQERKELERSYAGTATQAESLQEDRDRLAAELEQERHARQAAERPAVGRTEELGGTRAEAGRANAGGAEAERPDAGTTAPVYPGDAAAPTAAGTATQERIGEQAKPSLKRRLLGS